MPSENKYITLACPCSIRRLESPCVYNKETDELYVLGDDALEFLEKCDGTRTLGELGGDPEFLSYCLKERILAALESSRRRYFNPAPSPRPSLRYLELHLTTRCNLRCRHCYLRAGKGADLGLKDVFKAFEEFDALQGLRMLISGGEPLTHKGFWYINERVRGYGFRSVLLTNGTLITRETASRLKVHEAQVSLDGMELSHDLLRGEGNYKKAVRGIEYLTAAGIRVSVATMVTAINKYDFDLMGRLMESLGIAEWNVDMPSLSGRLRKNPGFLLPPQEAAGYLSYGFGGGNHGSPEGYACGAHLCAVGSNGGVARCGFYLDRPVGDISEGLKTCWERIIPVRLEQLECDCDHKDECKGGCRYRAATYSGALGPDPVRCAGYGLSCRYPKGGEGHDYQEGGEGMRRCV